MRRANAGTTMNESAPVTTTENPFETSPEDSAAGYSDVHGDSESAEEMLPQMPAPYSGELDGIEEFGSLRNWVSFDAPRGKLTCRSQETEYEEFVGSILESRVVRVMKADDGMVSCASSDRVTADTGRPGKLCADCEDRDLSCFPRWWIAWQDSESGLLFAHTLSQTGSLNFNRYAGLLKSDGLLPSQVLTRIYVEEARRQKTGTVYRRIQFEQVDGAI